MPAPDLSNPLSDAGAVYEVLCHVHEARAHDLLHSRITLGQVGEQEQRALQEMRMLLGSLNLEALQEREGLVHEHAPDLVGTYHHVMWEVGIAGPLDEAAGRLSRRVPPPAA